MMLLRCCRLLSSFSIVAFSLAFTIEAKSSSGSTACQVGSFAGVSREGAIPGALITDIETEYWGKREVPGIGPYAEDGKVESTCQVRLTYAYPQTNTSSITVTIWLPDEDRWNERFLGIGGGGWQTLLSVSMMTLPNQDGYATAGTDGGLTGVPFATDYTLLSPGNPNKHLVERLGYKAIHEMTILAKQVVQVYYGRPSKTNIYSGCSTGGRQGMMEASRYPFDYDGIIAAAPAVRWNKFVPGHLAGQALMSEAKYLPTGCEMQAITDAAIEACDGLDGLVDGVVARPDLCKFHASSVVGKEYDDSACCGAGHKAKITAEGAEIVQQFTDGIYASNGEKIFQGNPWGTPLWHPPSVGSTKEDKGGRTFAPMSIADQWAHHLLLNGLDPINYATLTVDDVQSFSRRSALEYTYTMEPDNYDLRQFKNRGGKIITFHGLQDNLIPVGNTLSKYTEVQDALYPRHTFASSLEQMQSFWRVFVVPGIQHCAPFPGNKGPSQADAYRQVTKWVEEGIEPERLQGYKVSADGSSYAQSCLWPSKPFWKSADEMECQSGISASAAYASITELTTQFFERLPSWLLLEPWRERREL